jgi:large subunit ribosomal protein L24
MASVDIRRNDLVKVIAGRDKGKQGRVLRVIPEKGKVLVEHVSMVKKNVRPNPQKQIKGGIAERESPIAVSNVMVLTSGGVPTRIGYRTEGATRVRIAKKGGEILDKK